MRKRNIIILAILAVILIVGIYAWNEYHRTNKDLSKIEAAYTVNAAQLIHEFDAGDSTADKKYLGKVVAVNGKIKQVEKDEDGYYTVVLGQPSEMSAIRCSMDTTYTTEVSNLKDGQDISIKGMFTGFQKDETGLLGSDVKMNRCVIQKN